ncbi:helix-turn-helix domain-containing protein [Bacillus thermotolerans]|uniref:helix-turn-helix domain-containing protein n=1 Tax=Bacillus thermotolerans TaxID=1221996 RepID=UPI000582DF0C|nr:helix-turn-helix transcriptional regulator [Bacillus thermotolerans]KKB33792.1 hypothetical protein QY97_03003 [Bacillus thermotolerans]
MDHFGLYLRNLRGKRSLRELSKATGLSHTYLSTLEKGVDPRTNKPRKPTIDTINKLAAALDVDRFEMLEKAGLLDEETISILNRAKEIRKMKMRVATREEVKEMSRKQHEQAIDIEELFSPLHSNLLKYKEHLLTIQDKKKLLDLMKKLFDE